MPVHECPNGKWRIGRGKCIYDTKEKANAAYRAYLAETHGKGVGKMPVRLKNIVISFISLVKAGANNRKIIIKAIDGEPSVEFKAPIMKIDEDGRRFYSVVYAPDEEDLQGEFASAEDIQKAAYDFMKNLRAINIDKNHSFESEQAFVAESWLIRKNDPMFPEEKEGSWAVGIIVEDDDVWKEIIDGEIEAVSMGGIADKIQDQAIDKAMDYDAAEVTENFWEVFRPLEASIRSILEDDEVEDKKAAVGASIDQFRERITAMVKDEKGSFIEGLKKALSVILLKSKKKGGESDMKKEEIQEMIDNSIKEALKEAPKPLSKEDMTEVVKVAMKPTLERIEALEKTSKGSKQGNEEITTDADLEAIGADIAKAINEK